MLLEHFHVILSLQLLITFWIEIYPAGKKLNDRL